jgi:hypothetical protein
MVKETATKKPRKANPNSKAMRIRKLADAGKLTPKQIAEKLDVPVQYVYVVRSKMKAQAGGLPAVSTKSPIPVSGGIQAVAQEAAVRPVAPEDFKTPNWKPIAYSTPRMSPALRPAHVTLEKPTFIERIKERVRAWLA